MSARKEGGVLVRKRKLGRVYALRFRAYGERRYLTLGFEHEGWDLAKAEVELQNVLADVRRGLWVPPKKKRRSARLPPPGEVPDLEDDARWKSDVDTSSGSCRAAGRRNLRVRAARH